MKRSWLKTRQKPLKRVGWRRKLSKRPTRAKSGQERALWASYGLSRPPKPRFKGLAGILWYVMSRAIRKEEFEKYGGKCVSCATILKDWRLGDCAHFRASSRGMCTRFLRLNLALSCKKCNNPTWSPDAAGPFAVELDRRYGLGTALSLIEQSRKICPEPPPAWYDAEIKRYLGMYDSQKSLARTRRKS